MNRIAGLAGLIAVLVLSFGCGGGGSSGDRSSTGTGSTGGTTPPKITSSPAQTSVLVGFDFSYAMTVTGSPAPTVTVTGAAGGPLPSFLTFDAGNLLLSGRPAAADLGTHDIEVVAANGNQPDDTQDFTITVTGFQVRPQIVSQAILVATEGQTYTYPVVATGSPAPTVTATGASGGTLPLWLTFTAANNTLSGVPGPNDVGQHDVELTASNGVAPDATQNFTIAVGSAGGPSAPQITSAAPSTATAGTAYSYDVQVTGSPLPTITVTGLPSFLTFTAPNTISGTPTAFDLGTTQTITVTADNGNAPNDTESIVITVSPATGLDIATLGPLVETFGTQAPTDWAATAGWEFGQPLAGVGPPDALYGDCAGTNLIGNYQAGVTETLQTPVLDLTGVPSPVLQFHHFFEVEILFDGAQIQISEDGGVTFDVIDPSTISGQPYNTTGLALAGPGSALGLPCWGGTIRRGDWEQVEVDLAANLNTLTDDAFQTRSGLYLDDVRIGDASTFPDQDPRFSSKPVVSAVPGEAYTYNATATGQPTPTVTQLTLPAGLAISSGTPGQGAITGSIATAGIHPTEITAASAANTANQSFDIEVLPAGTLPVFEDGFEDPNAVVARWSVLLFSQNVATAGTDWTLGSPATGPPTPTNTGARCLGTDMAGDYTPSPPSTSTTTPSALLELLITSPIVVNAG
ncbi:MAG: putative Ig domain-containing protein, partial [Planctomycetota bacterium]